MRMELTLYLRPRTQWMSYTVSTGDRLCEQRGLCSHMPSVNIVDQFAALSA
jgi:hypothetical protein